jgi:hypothetical protein
MPVRARKKEDRPILFAGPTLASSKEARALAKSCQLRRPVRRHDIDKLVAERKTPGTLVIVDGVFHDTLAVGHAELRVALARGWRIWGLSSMGAIRAREMAHLGMRGFGQVFARFAADGDFQDDEVALLHEPSAPYHPVSEPLIHLRAAIDHLVAENVVSAAVAGEVIADLKGRWYGERTVRRAIHALKGRSLAGPAAVEDALRPFDRFRWKTLDLVRFLKERPFLDLTPPPVATKEAPRRLSSTRRAAIS